MDDRAFLRSVFDAKGVEGGDVEGWVLRKQEATLAMLDACPRVYEGVKELVALLAGKARLGVVSTTWRANIDAVLRSSGMLGAFEVIVGKEDVKAPKPDPEGYLMALRRLKVKPEDAIALEDSATGLAAARAAAIRAIAVGHRAHRRSVVGRRAVPAEFRRCRQGCRGARVRPAMIRMGRGRGVFPPRPRPRRDTCKCVCSGLEWCGHRNTRAGRRQPLRSDGRPTASPRLNGDDLVTYHSTPTSRQRESTVSTEPLRPGGITNPGGRILASLLLAALAIHGEARADYVDQSNTEDVLYGYGVFGPSQFLGNAQEIAQTFTISGGGILSRVAVAVSNTSGTTSPLTFDLRNTVGGVPVADDSLVLARITLPASAVPPIYPQSPSDYLIFDVSSFNIAVSPGEVLAFDLGKRTPVTNSYGAIYNTGDRYKGGGAFTRYPGQPGGFLPNASSDIGFIVYAVPEPSSLVMLGLGMWATLAFVGKSRIGGAVERSGGFDGFRPVR